MESPADYRLTPPATCATETEAAGPGPFFVGFQRRAEELQLEYFAVKQRAEKAEARIKEQQAELAEQ